MTSQPYENLVASRLRRAAIAAVLFTIGYRSAWSQVAYCKNASGTGTYAYTLSLPRSSPITNSAQLLASIPGAVAVNKFNPVNNQFWRENGSGFCGMCLSPPFVSGVFCVGSPGEPGASPYCFKVNPGDGFVVVSNAPAQYPVPGVDTPSISIPLLQPTGGVNQDGSNFISLPVDTVAADAKQLMDDIGFAQVANVQRYLAATDSFQAYTGRKGTGTAWPIVPGEAYFVKMNTTVNYLPSHYGGTPLVCSTSPSTYHINGSANTSDFSFALLDGTGVVKCWSNCASLTNGGSASQVATDLKAAVNAACTGIASAASSADSVTIVTLSGGPSLQNLKVGTSNCANTTTPVASCAVAFKGSCTFNPTITFSCGSDGTACDDQNACSVNDRCMNGTCAGSCYCAARPTGLAGWWPAEGNANDISGTGNHGMLLGGATFGVGKVGQAFSLNGVDSYVRVPYSATLVPGAGSFSVGAWINTSQASGGHIFTMYECGGSCPSGTTNSLYELFLSAGVPSFALRDSDIGGGIVPQSITGPPSVADGAWHLVVATRDVVAHTMNLYVDDRARVSSALGASADGPIQNNDSEADPEIIGAEVLGGANTLHGFFQGLIDELMYANRAFAPAEIKAIYDAGAQGVCKQCTDADGDGYGVAGDVCSAGPLPDCAAGNPSLWGPGSSIGYLKATKTAQPGTVSWFWPPAGGGTALAVVYDFGRDGDGLPPECILHDSPATNATESAIPNPGSGFFFLLRADDACGGEPLIPMCP